MSAGKNPAVAAQSAEKESKISMMMIIFLVILIWAVVAYFMTMTPAGKEQAHQQAAVEQPAPAAGTGMQQAVAPGVQQAPVNEQQDPVKTMMDVFAPSGK